MPTLFLAIGAIAVLGTACGDDDDDNHPDARIIDAANPIDGGEIDGGGPDGAPVATRAGTLAVSELRLTTTDANVAPPNGPGGLAGQAISIAFSDLTTGGVVPAYADETLPTTGCSVSIFTVGTDIENPLVDEGIVTIGSPETGDSGIIDGNGDPMPASTCTFNADTGYNCLLAGGQGTVTVANNGNGTATYLFTDGLDAAPNRKGMVLNAGGFANAANNGTFPVLFNASGTVIVFNPGAVAATNETIQYGFIVGASPIPGGVDFLTDGLNGTALETVHIQKAAGTVLPAFDLNVQPNGEGFTLEGTQPHELPTDGSAATFTCANDDCGPQYATFNGLVISGRTTSAAVPAHPDYIMPPTSAMTAGQQYATFQCAFIGQTSATIPAAAMALIMGTNPTRIETRIFNFGATFENAGPNRTNVVIGHGLMGHTTVTN